MSYILEALIKSDQERQQRAAPGLHTVHPPAVLEARQPARWPYMAATTLLAGAVGSAAWLYATAERANQAAAASAPRQAQANQGNPQANQANPVAAPSAGTAPQAPSAAPAAVRRDAPARPTRSDDGRRISDSPARGADHAGPLNASSPAAEPVPIIAAPAPEPRSPGRAVSGNGVVFVAELPASVQKEVPKLSISGYSHSVEADERMAIINDRALREGDEVTAGLKVEKISTEGVVFSYRGYRFRVAAN